MIIKKGYKKTDIGEIPVDWEVISYEDAFRFLSTASYSRSQLKQEDKVSYIHYGDIHTKWTNFLDFDIENLPFVSEEQAKKYPFLEEGDLVMADASEDYAGVGASVEIKNLKQEKVISGLHTFLLRSKENVFANGFKGYIHCNHLVKRQLDKLATGLKVYSISKSSLKQIKIPLPPLPEQKVIAKVLSDMDNLITALEAEIEKMRLVKQGAMQELLSAGDDWEVRSLGEIANITMGQSPSSSSYNQSKIGLPLVQGNADIKNRKTIIRNYTSEITKTCEVNDIIMSVRAPVGEIAKATFDACLGRGVCAITYENDFIYHYLIFIEPTWSKLSTGSTFDSVNSTVIRNLEIPLPPLSEQTKITTILTDIDLTIGSKEAELEKYRAMKVGLMQELLSGKRRLVRG